MAGREENRRESERRKLYSMLGKLPEIDRKPHAISRKDIKGYPFYLEKLVLDLNGIEPVPAYFLKPKKTAGRDRKIAGRLPLVIYNHAHGSAYNIGKDEILAGRKSLQAPPYGKLLTDMGYCVLCIDHWAFGERNRKDLNKGGMVERLLEKLGLRDIPTEPYIFKDMLWNGRVMWGMMVYDSIKAIDYALTRDDVDKNRIATIGISMGSTMAWWLAALDRRIKVCVDICCLTDFHELIKEKGLGRHGLYYYVPGLANEFTTAEINALIAPRAHLSLAGWHDPLTPEAGLRKIDEELKKVYSKVGDASAWKLIIYDSGHKETKGMRREIIDFLKSRL